MYVDVSSLSFLSCRFYVDGVHRTWENGTRTGMTAGMKVRWLSSGAIFMCIVSIWLARIKINTRANESFSIDFFRLLKFRYIEPNAKARKRFQQRIKKNV